MADGQQPPNDQVYGDWRWEQIVNGVTGLTVPAREDVTGVPWIQYTNDGDTDNAKYLIFWANSWDKHIRVYLNPDLVANGGKWQTYVDTPNTSLAEAAFNRRYELLQINPRTFYDVAAAFNWVSNWLSATGTDLDGRYRAIGTGKQLAGKAAGAFRDLIGNVSGAVNGFHHQMTTGTKPFDQAMSDAGLSAENFVVDLWNTYYQWRNSADAMPWNIIMSLLSPMEQKDTTYKTYSTGGRGGGHKTTTEVDHEAGYIQNWRNSPYGDMVMPQTWVNIENAAKQRWLANVGSTLDTGARAAITTLAGEFTADSTALVPLTLPPMTKIQPDPTDPNAAVDDNIAKLNDNMNKGFGDLGKGVGDIGKGLDPTGGKDPAGLDTGGLNPNAPGGPGAGGLPGGGADGGLANTGGPAGGLPAGNDLTGGTANPAAGLPGAGIDPATGLPNAGIDPATGLPNSGIDPATGLPAGAGPASGLGADPTGGLGGGPVPGGAGGVPLPAVVPGPISGVLNPGGSAGGRLKTGAPLAGGDTLAPPTSPVPSRIGGGAFSIPPLNEKPGAGFGGFTGGGGGEDLTGGVATPGGAELPGGAGAGLPPAAETPVSSGKFVAPGEVAASTAAGTAGAAAAGRTGGIPMYSPMAGGMGGGGAGNQQPQERERTTWLAEDEDVWGTDPVAGPAVIGRSAELDEDDDTAFTADPDEPRARRRRVQV